MPDTNLLIKIAADLATNTKATEGIEEHLRQLNSKVATHSVELSTLKRNLIIVGTIAATLLISSGSELVNFILKLI